MIASVVSVAQGRRKRPAERAAEIRAAGWAGPLEHAVKKPRGGEGDEMRDAGRGDGLLQLLLGPAVSGRGQGLRCRRPPGRSPLVQGRRPARHRGVLHGRGAGQPAARGPEPGGVRITLLG